MKLSEKEVQELTKVAEAASQEAGRYIQSRFDQDVETRKKTGGDSLASQVVTEVDLNAQSIILEILKPSITRYDLGLLTEELEDDHSRLVKDFFWCIDPMDGTLPFTEKRSGYSVSIALVSKQGHSVIGVVYIPDQQLCYSARIGEGVKLNGMQFRRETKRDRHLHVYMDNSFLTDDNHDFVKTELAKWREYEVHFHTSYGGVRNAIAAMNTPEACYFKFPRVRQGGGSIWDYAATSLMFEETGLCISDAQGKRLHLNDRESSFMNKNGILFATDTRIQDKIIEIGQKIHN